MLPTGYIHNNKSFWKSIGLILWIGIVYFSSAQAYGAEHWKSIRTPHYDVFFLEEMAREAQRVANIVEALYLPTAKTLQVTPVRIPIILRSRMAESNGFVTLLPSRKSVFSNFPANKAWFLMNNDWFNILAIHELRHIAQFEHQLSSYNLVDLSFLLPDQMWLHEGDAVGIETALSTGGRGRSPYFSLLYKINLLERGGFSYYKQMIGSLQHQIPNHYRLGYFLTTYLRREYGADVIRQLMLRDGPLEYINPFTFYNKIKKLTGKSIKQIYQDAHIELTSLWKQQLKGLNLTLTQPISARKTKDYTNYTYPQPLQEEVIVLKSGIAIPTQFVKIDGQGNETILCTPVGLTAEDSFSLAQGKVVWIRHESPHAFIDEKPSLTTIQSYNLQTNKFTTIGPPNRYHVASLSPDGTQIAVSLTDTSYQHHLKILHAATGEVLQQFSNPNNNYYLTPSWSPDGKQVVVVTHAHNQATITCINLQTGEIEDILPYSREAIDEPILQGEYIYYSSPYSGIDNIYAIHRQTKQRFQVTSSQYGAYHPAISPDGKWLLYNDCSKNGMDAVKILLNPKQWLPITQVQDRSIRYYQPLVTQEDNASILTKIPHEVYPTKPHKIWQSLVLKLRFSYRPLLNGSLEAVLHDLLRNAEWTLAGYRRDHANNILTQKLFTGFSYQTWKPLIGAELSLLRITSHPQKHIYSREASVFLQIPFTWYEGAYTHQFTINTKSQVNTWHTPTKWYVAQNYIVRWERMSARSTRDIYSPWGQTFKIHYTHVLNRPALQHCATQCSLHFPGLRSHHAIRVGVGYQYKTTSLPIWDDPTFKLHHLSLSKDHQLSWCIDYWFPIAYPDWEPLPYILVQRLGTNLFYDYAYDIRRKRPTHSIGLDFTMDISWLHVALNFMYHLTNSKLDFDMS